MSQFNLPLPEITVEDFEHSWTHFGVIADANNWNKEKHLPVVPALLQGSLDTSNNSAIYTPTGQFPSGLGVGRNNSSATTINIINTMTSYSSQEKCITL